MQEHADGGEGAEGRRRACARGSAGARRQEGGHRPPERGDQEAARGEQKTGRGEQEPALPPEEDVSGATRPPPIKKPPLIVDNSPEPDPKPVPRAARGAGALDGLLGGKKDAAPARPSTYVVQPGDNLMSIALRFYGARSKWRDIQKANMVTIPADGRVKAGQTIKLP